MTDEIGLYPFAVDEFHALSNTIGKRSEVARCQRFVVRRVVVVRLLRTMLTKESQKAAVHYVLHDQQERFCFKIKKQSAIRNEFMNLS